MSTILHLSDLHFGAPFLSDVAEAVVDHAEALEPDVVVVSGDLTQRARMEQFREAAEYLQRFSRPVVVTPGNHDVPFYRFWARFFAPYAGYRRFIESELNTVTELSGLVLVALNSSRRFTLTNGRIRRSQLDFATRAFEDAEPSAVRVVVTHHHLAPAPDFIGGTVMPYARRAMARFTRLKVDLIMAGHMHRSYVGSSLDFFPGELQRHGIAIVQCGTTTSKRGRGRERFRNTLNVIRIGEGTIRVAHHAWFGELSRFMPISEHVFPLGARQYLGERSAAEIGVAK
ncbi:MAG: metallophosphoesterase [Gemmatimonadetes bacterium]|uniref:Metallophosphoesterase n=1 Tax=Candidatus Kutchimonas denitrificans TaxID=3056748 RepID=A0AAE4Z821_9BACT|nr:metallophosphoesterase [Gemmatimonadota bacterium]NIR75530.1 metallophosphoesterase [Candidatus Kutchimonas denitrificans]NIS01844.1 metallophosphoesterase [Gemmatimonadota bacterium]NIT67625.1 metallophosphoesterase [Gemmatimonadota bacterium]NIU53499.1 3',5'-cyclic-nucleotide phosphodiesterase [Gemmatimonadota bacterium]